MFRSCQIIIRELCCLLFLPFKYQLNCEYCNITLARDKAPWWWSDKIETFRSVLKCFKSILCEMTCAFVGWWIGVILQKSARCCTCFEQFLCPSSAFFHCTLCYTYRFALCTVKNCWWWTEELSGTCRALFQK